MLDLHIKKLKNRLTIFITSYNYGHFIDQAIESVIKQTSPDWNLVILDNGSTDKTEQVVQPFLADDRISFYRRPENIGHKRNIVSGFRDIRSEFVATLQADDFLKPEFVETALAAFDKHPSIPYVAQGWDYYYEERSEFAVPRTTPFSPDFSGLCRLSLYLNLGNFIPLHLAVFRRQCLDIALDELEKAPLMQVGELTLFKACEDKYGPAYYIAKSGGVWRQHGNQLTGQHVANSTAYIEEPLERVWYVREAKDPHPDCVFMSLLTFNWMTGRTSFRLALNWLTGEQGQVFLQSHGLPTDQASLNRWFDLAFVLGLKRTVYTPFTVYEGDDVALLLLHYAENRQLNTLRAILEHAALVLGPTILPVDEVDGLQASYKIELDDVIAKEEQKAKKETPIRQGSYQQWLDRHAISEAETDGFALRYQKRGSAKKFDLVVRLKEGEQSLLAQTLDSLQRLLVPSWRLVVIADQPSVDDAFSHHPNLAWIQVPSLEDDVALCEGFNYLAANSDADYFALLPIGFLIEPHALLMAEDYFDLHPAWQVLYTDHDYVGFDLMPLRPQFKPDFDRYYLYSYDYIGAAVFVSRDALYQIGGLQPYPEAEVFDLLLRISDQCGDDIIGHLAEPLLHLPDRTVDQKHLAYAARRVALEQHFAQAGLDVTIGSSLHDDVFHIDFACKSHPLISIIIPNKDKIEFLQPCIESLLTKTDYPAYEIIIVDNDSHDPDILKYYGQLQQRLGDRLQLLYYREGFNFSAQVNLGVAHARGNLVLLLNNDTEVIQPMWLQRMVALISQPGVGVVGARLLFPEHGTVQHAGVMIGGSAGPEVIAEHQFIHHEGNAAGYMNRIWSMQSTIVTAACMLIRKETYQALSGYNEQDLAVLYNDVDFCLRAMDAGYRCLYQPFASMMHHGSASLKAATLDDLKRHLNGLIRASGEREYMLRSWLDRLAIIPTFNRNLDLTNTAHRVSSLPVPWDPLLSHLPTILSGRLSGGSGEYRVEQPLRLLRQLGLMHTAVIPIGLSEGVRLPTLLEVRKIGCQTLMVQNPITDIHLLYLEMYKKYVPELKVIVGLDDLLGAVPEKSGVYVYHQRYFRDARSRLRKALRYADRLLVSTQPLVDAFADMIDDIVVVPNRLRKEDWGYLQKPRLPVAGRKLRVGWVGAQQHQGDLELIAEVVKETAHEVDWVFMGMWPEGVDEFIKEKHGSVSFSEYPAKVATLQLDIALAPLEDNAFNEAKSNLRLLEYGAMGWSVICSDVYPFRTNDPPVCRVDGSKEQWLREIRARLANPEQAWAEGDRLRAWVDKYYWLEEHPQDWYAALT